MIKHLQVKIHFCLLLTVLFFSSTANAFTTGRDNGEASKPNRHIFSKDSIIRILAIGNSFSEDAVEHYLYGLAKAGGYKVVIGNLYIGGCPLDRHWKNASGDSAAYNYRKTDVNGNKDKTPKVAMSTALADENWDFISFQQASPKSGLFDTYLEPLPPLFKYVKDRATNPNVQFIFHQTWAYAQASQHKGFASYNNNQMDMYHGIMDASSRAMKLVDFNLLVPAGTAIQNARTSFIGDNLCRDGYHLNLYVGRYIASCAWYEAVFKQSVIGNTYIPEKVTVQEAAMAQAAAHAAIKKPYKVTKLKKFAKLESE